jgi:thiazole synthase
MWQLAGVTCHSRLLMGSANYPSLEILSQSLHAAQASVVTVSLKRENPAERGGHSFWATIKRIGCTVLPNTAGCRTAKEAIYVAQMARDIFETHWIKLEVIGDDYLLHPDPFEMVIAANELVGLGFEVFPFCTEDLILCQKLYDGGCRILMPWGAPIGSGKGLLDPFKLSLLRERLPEAILIIDAGIGSPEHAMQAMLLGFDAVLVNSAIAQAHNPVLMAQAFKLAVQSGYFANKAGIMPSSDLAMMSTPLAQTLYWGS